MQLSNDSGDDKLRTIEDPTVHRIMLAIVVTFVVEIEELLEAEPSSKLQDRNSTEAHPRS